MTHQATATTAAAALYSKYTNVARLIKQIQTNGLPGYIMDCCDKSGSLMVKDPEHPDVAIFATPWWEGECCLDFAIMDGKGELLYLESLPMHYTGNVKADAAAWAEAVQAVLPTHGLH